MASHPIDEILAQTLEDRRLSRAEKRSLREVLADYDLNADKRAVMRQRAFKIARETYNDARFKTVLEWLEDVVKTIGQPSKSETKTPPSRAFFSPGDDCTAEIITRLDATGRTLDLCVFTITDDRLSRAVVNAHKRGVRVRIITDNDKSFDLGSDIEKFEQIGIPVRVDQTTDHMHHKFAIFDGRLLLTGSYNWTRSAALGNYENFIVTGEPRLITAFSETFSDLWKRFE